MKKILILLAIAAATITAQAKQTMWVCAGQVKYAFNTEQLDTMPINGGTSFTVLNKTFNVNEVDSIYFDNNEFDDTYVSVTYNGNTANVIIAGNIAQYMNAYVNGAHVAVTQNSDVTDEIVYQLQGSTTNGSFYQDGELKITLILNGVTIHNPDSAAINIRDGKRIAIELANGTTNTLTDGTGGSQKGCFAVKGHSEFKGAGTLNITGNSKNAFWGKEYVELKKSLGTINILGAVGDGFNINQYFQQNGGAVNISGVGDDGIQVSYATDDDDNIEDDPENTATITLKGGSLTMTMTSDGGKGLKAEKDVEMSGGTLTITQSGNIVVEENDLSYSTSVKADGDINITGGTINITNTAQGGKGLSADGAINIDESKATTVIDIKANGEGGIAENTGGTDPQVQTSYKIYVALPTSSSGGGPGGGQSGGAWKVVYLYKSDGTLVQKLTNTVTRSSGYNTVTFYYYDFGAADNGEYYFKADNYRSFDGKTYTIRTNTFSGPTSGNDIYYMISNSYQTSGTTRYYSFSDVTSTYGGSGEVDEEDGTGYNAAGIKADGNLTISGGTITVANSGLMSKSLKSKAIVTINGGNITLTPSGGIKVIGNDASYSTGIKALDCVINDGTINITVSGQCGKGISAGNNTTSNGTITTNGGTLTINLTTGATGYGSSSTNNRHTAKGMKADGNMALNAGNITVSTVTAGAKAIKVNGSYTQGTSDGNGPTLSLSTTGSRYGASSSSSGPGGMGGKTTGQGGAAKCIKAEGSLTINGGSTEVSTAADGGEGIEGKTGVYINGGQHYLKCYDDCVSTNGPVQFNGGVTVAHSFGNDAVDSNYGRSGAIVIGNGTIFAFSTKGGAEEGLDCDNNSYIQITGNGIAISAGGSQGGGGSWGGSSGIGSAVQGYYLTTNSISYTSGRYYTIATSSGTNLVTYSFPASVSSNLSLITATGMVKGSSYQWKYSTTAPTDATTSFHGLYLGSSHTGTTNVLTSGNFTAQ